MYLAATVLYAVSAFAINRVMKLIETRTRVPGFVAAGGMGGGH
jgi:glutamate/aspartate transport system permease protein